MPALASHQPTLAWSLYKKLGVPEEGFTTGKEQLRGDLLRCWPLNILRFSGCLYLSIVVPYSEVDSRLNFLYGLIANVAQIVGAPSYQQCSQDLHLEEATGTMSTRIVGMLRAFGQAPPALKSSKVEYDRNVDTAFSTKSCLTIQRRIAAAVAAVS